MHRYRPEWDYIEWNDTEAESPVLLQLRQGLTALGMTERVLSASVASVCPYAALPRSFDEYLASHSAKGRRRLRHARQALEREGLQFLALHDGAKIQRWFGEFVRLHRLRFDRKGKASGFWAPAVQAFHADVLTHLAANGWARLFLLQVKGSVIAALYGFSTGKRFLGYQSGWDPAWARLSVGRFMLFRTIEELIRSGHDEYDFLRGDEAYKFQWASGTRQTRTVCLFDRRVKSQWGLAQVLVREQVEQMKQLLRRSAVAHQVYWQATRWFARMKRLCGPCARSGAGPT